ncbi:hypothetical protein FP2506_13049 [Fulvimarina pelagi HTCC2506]|uniref:Uncharacterized protein n=2 Tax=Fulvimarina pelagi TaxID=217511 RepID=Q0G186_9HYPH|nr:hypothetical protein FP2506_13049 [Fulvimarina pelagi HTCC2506]BAT30794.1 hypothetical protein [Fulvimarina pelagi]
MRGASGAWDESDCLTFGEPLGSDRGKSVAVSGAVAIVGWLWQRRIFETV